MANNINQQVTISMLKFPDNVRESPEIYIDNINHGLYEIIDNSVDEHIAGYCSVINVRILKSGFFQVQDNGRGIPVAPSPDNPKLSQAEVALSTLAAGGKFSGKEGSMKEETAGKNGVGSSCVNALAEYFQADIFADGHRYTMSFKKGHFAQHQTIAGDVDKNVHGTAITYMPDKEIYAEDSLDIEALKRRLKQYAYLNPGLTLYLTVEKEEGEPFTATYKSENGMQDFYSDKIKGKKPHFEDTIAVNKTIEIQKLGRPLTVSVVLGYVEGYSQDLSAFVNGLASNEGGDHVNGFNAGVNKAVRQYALEHKSIKKDTDLEMKDTEEGVVGIISVRIKKPKFGGQNKQRLDMPIIRTPIADAIYDELYNFMEKNPNEAKIIVEKALRAKREREKVKRIRETERGLKKMDSKAMTLGKLADCTSKDPEISEIYLVEGDSAGGSAKNGRDNKTQAILPIFGKIPNVIKNDMSVVDVLKDKIRLGVVVAALGCGIGNNFNIEKIRYHKIVPLADADADGSHIQIEWICFFWKFMPEVIRRGYLYLPQPPLYRAVKKGQEARWYYTEGEKDQALNAHELDGWTLSRFKGLGEMEAEQLWETTLNPETRKFYQVTVNDAEEATNIIELCMGKNVTPRKEMIMKATFSA